MAHQNLQNNKDHMNLILSSDAKPRLKWTPELHQRFIDSVNQLGGPDKATPKSLMRVMGIHGLTLYHLKSHLQKYRLGKSQQLQSNNESKPEEQCEADEGENQETHLTEEICDRAENQINESMKIAQALQVQMEVQRKLYEQIEVQRHLQLRIEAQGKYLQSILRKAQDTLSEYNSSAIGVQLAKEELSQLVSSMFDIGCYPISSLSALTDHTDNSITSSESSGIKDRIKIKSEIDENAKWNRKSVLLTLMEMQPGQNSHSINQSGDRKRAGNYAISVEQTSAKRFQSQKSCDHERTFDLNRKCLNDFDSLGPRTLDLNCKGGEQFDET